MRTNLGDVCVDGEYDRYVELVAAGVNPRRHDIRHDAKLEAVGRRDWWHRGWRSCGGVYVEIDEALGGWWLSGDDDRDGGLAEYLGGRSHRCELKLLVHRGQSKSFVLLPNYWWWCTEIMSCQDFMKKLDSTFSNKVAPTFMMKLLINIFWNCLSI